MTGMQRNDSDELLAGPYPSYGMLEESETSYGVTRSQSGVLASAQHILDDIRALQGGRERVWAAALCCVVASLSSFISGMMLSFSSATVLELDGTYRDGDYVHGIAEGSTYSSLFASFGALGGSFGGLSAWPISDRFGRKPALMLGGVFSLAGWLLIACAHFVSESRSGFLAVLLVGRLLTGFGGGWAIFCVSVYIAEVASAKLKGLFGALNQFFLVLGILVAYALGAFAIHYDAFRYYHVATITVGFVVIFEFLMLFTRETPRWLFTHRKDMVAARVLQFLRGPKVDIQKEMRGIQRCIGMTKSLSLAEVIRAVKRRSVYIPFILATLLMFFQQLSGINIAFFYAGTILMQGGKTVREATIIATIFIGVVQVLMTFVAVVLVDYLGRRVLLIASSIGALLGTFLPGVHFFVLDHKCHGCLGINCTDDNNVTHLNDFSPCNSTNLVWLAVVGLAMLIAAFSIGWGPIPWLAMSELLPLRLRGLLGSVVSMLNWLCAFVVTVSFLDYVQAVTPAFAWWSYSIMTLIGIFFVVLFLPETKHKSLEEIEENFERRGIFADTCKCVWREHYLNVRVNKI